MLYLQCVCLCGFVMHFPPNKDFFLIVLCRFFFLFSIFCVSWSCSPMHSQGECNICNTNIFKMQIPIAVAKKLQRNNSALNTEQINARQWISYQRTNFMPCAVIPGKLPKQSVVYTRQCVLNNLALGTFSLNLKKSQALWPSAPVVKRTWGREAQLAELKCAPWSVRLRLGSGKGHTHTYESWQDNNIQPGSICVELE